MNKVYAPWFIAVAAVLPLLASRSVAASEIWVFTAEGAPALRSIERADQHFVLRLNDPTLKKLTFPYPGSEAAARKMALAQIQSPQGKALISRIRTNSEARVMAWMIGIERLPAVLVDRAFVVYGGDDVSSALDAIARHRQHAD
mgnify:CR=1 FL=1